ncbi:uncharacterized protein LOC131941239 [Physella acuta]|uniref:uncharacterized protein LOC131941239 n=1 Tax=Physella acuta TaxID=109671 RepID=UPI0027DCCF9E|nr:uncharacterized protein LOC131941239 [Physella acuta]
MGDMQEVDPHTPALGRRSARSGGKTNGASAVESDMLTEGIHGYEQITQSAISRLARHVFSTVLVPLAIMAAVPNVVVLMWYTVMHCGGSYNRMLAVFTDRSLLHGLGVMWSRTSYPSAPIVWILVAYGIYALAMMKVLPGKYVTGPVTPKGNVPVYKDNGFTYFVLTIALFWLLTLLLHPFGISPSILYDKFDEVLFALNAFSPIFCVFLYLKGKFAPSSTDSGSSGNVIFDYYWGMELYPRVFGFDIKVFTNCRFGMMSWALMVCVHAVKSYELHGFVDSMFVSAVLQLLYITKFFWWESGYLRTIDIMVDRAGFYICWGCLVFLPGFYAAVTSYLVSHPVNLGPGVAAGILFSGAASIYINYAADAQKQKARGANGNCTIWGRRAEIVHARYRLENGDVKENILLASGWWGLSRHFHYIPEILLAFFWSVPALFDHLLPYTYVIYLTVLLIQRSYRDEIKCGLKYGDFWHQYCRKVPHKIVPFIF